MPKHIVRLIALIVVGIALATIVKHYLTAESFYRYGHYRADSVGQIAAQEPAFQGAGYCQACHSERHALWSANSHKTVTCEVCHGAAQGHPQKGKLPIPADPRKLCTLCHEQMAERPLTQPQVDSVRHSVGQQCTVCHNPHAPKIAGGGATARGDAAAGRSKHSESCAGCHGANGISSNDTWPNLAGQNPAYLARILAAYKSGDQKDVAMTPITQTLGDADIQNLAAYYAGASCGAPPSAARAGDPVEGKILAKNCSACHGETGIGANPAWPRIAGQKSGYLVNVLKAFRAGLRKDPTMAGVTRGLSDADIANLAAYYAVQSCVAPRETRKIP